MGVFKFLLFAVIISLIITIISKYTEKKKHEKRINTMPDIITKYTYTTEEEYKQELIMQLRKLNANMVTSQILEEEQKEIQKSIKEDVGLLTLILIIYIVIKVAATLLVAGEGYNILQGIL